MFKTFASPTTNPEGAIKRGSVLVAAFSSEEGSLRSPSKPERVRITKKSKVPIKEGFGNVVGRPAWSVGLSNYICRL